MTRCLDLTAENKYKTNKTWLNVLFDADKDECIDKPCGPQAADCTNVDGSYKCVCKDGFEAKDGSCTGPVY